MLFCDEFYINVVLGGMVSMYVPMLETDYQVGKRPFFDLNLNRFSQRVL